MISCPKLYSPGGQKDEERRAESINIFLADDHILRRLDALID
jgi:hypothetical protein